MDKKPSYDLSSVDGKPAGVVDEARGPGGDYAPGIKFLFWIIVLAVCVAGFIFSLLL